MISGKVHQATVPLKSKLPPLVSFLARRASFLVRRFSFLARRVSFLSRITDAFSMAYITRKRTCVMVAALQFVGKSMGPSNIKCASVLYLHKLHV